MWTHLGAYALLPTHSYLIFDLHGPILHGCLEETLGSSGWQQKRKFAVQALPEAAHRPQAPPKYYRKDKQASAASLFSRQKVHGEDIPKHRAI